MPQRKKVSQPTADTVLADCYRLGVADLKVVRDALDVLIEWLEQQEDLSERHPVAAAKIVRQGTGKRGSNGYVEKKIINGCGPYCYLRLKRGGTHHSFYLGKFE